MVSFKVIWPKIKVYDKVSFGAFGHRWSRVGASIVLHFIITASVVMKFVPITETERKSSDRLISKPV